MKRVVVTGMAGISPIGSTWAQVRTNLRAGKTGICHMSGWDKFSDFNTRLAAPVLDFEKPAHFNRKLTRSMGRGRIIPTSSACTSGSQGIGYAYEAIKFGRQKLMVAGGAEELCPTEATVFDTLFATRIRNEAPHTSPRPFDRDRDGLVIGEGAGTLILEELEHAQGRGATIYAELMCTTRLSGRQRTRNQH